MEYKRLKNKKDRLLTGFTLVELLIVFAVIAILSGILVANFPEIRQQLALKRTAHKLAQDIRWVQEMAMSSAKESGGCSNAKGYGIYIDIGNDNKKYILYADIDGDENYSSIADCIIKRISIEEKEIVIKEIKNATENKISINFKPPNPNVSIKWLQADKVNVEIVLALGQDLSKTKSVLVNNAGLIEIK